MLLRNEEIMANFKESVGGVPEDVWSVDVGMDESDELDAFEIHWNQDGRWGEFIEFAVGVWSKVSKPTDSR